MMTDPINADHKSSLLNRLVRWWRSRRSPRVRASNSGQVADAREAAAGSTNAVLAGKWPRSVNPLDQTLEQLNAFRDEPRSRTGMFAIGRRERLT